MAGWHGEQRRQLRAVAFRAGACTVHNSKARTCLCARNQAASQLPA